MNKAEEMISLPPSMEAELAIPIDKAADDCCQRLGLPLLGGPSGDGWSKWSVAQQCPYLFQQTFELGDGRERTKPAVPLQVGGLFHTLLALYYAYGLGDGAAFHYRRGLLAPSLAPRLHKRGRHAANEIAQIPNDAADQLLAALKLSAAPPSDASVVQVPGPSMSVILEAERIFDAHTQFYGDGQEDVQPLAIEWYAEHEAIGYSCRYDAIVKLDADDPFVREGRLAAGSIVAVEHKSAAWLSEWATDGWFLDGEILGQLLCWQPSGCERVFGPLAGLLVDVVTKEKTPKCTRILVSPKPATVAMYEKVIRWQAAELAMYRAIGYWPRRIVNCWRWGKPCGLYQHCQSVGAIEGALLTEGEADHAED